VPLRASIRRQCSLNSQLAKDKEREDREKAKAAALAKKKLDAELFKTVQTAQKVPFGTGTWPLVLFFLYYIPL
jgi:hypothetical protein